MTKITAPTGCNVYVATLPLDFTDQQLSELFAPYGAISSARVMRSKGTRQSKGYGFVMFKDARAAELAVVNLHGASIGSTSIQVRIAHPGASKAVRNGPGSRAAQSASTALSSGASDTLSSHTEDRNESTASDAAPTPASVTPQMSLAPQMPQMPVMQQPMLYPMPQTTLMPMMAAQQPSLYPAFTMPQPQMMMPESLSLMPSASQPQPMYVVILPDGRQAFVCGY